MLFVVPRLEAVDYRVAVGYSLVILYMMTPVDFLLTTVPIFTQAAVSMQAIERVGLDLGAAEPGTAASTAPDGPADPDRPWHRLELRGVTHAYTRDGEAGSFVLGPLDLTVHPGELLFVTGGNGSGKTTLAKLLTGLYRPEAGALVLDGVAIDETRLAGYRQHVSAVFSDFCLFDRLLGLDGPGLDGPTLDERARTELDRLELGHKVKVQGGAFSTLDLSQGQRKRLALLTACLEDRSLYLFDEWAADQDPHFKEIFYRQILPALKARGKAVVVVTHDDRYFDAADRLVKLELGRIVEERRQAPMLRSAPEAAGA